jgi:hypothetical protein
MSLSRGEGFAIGAVPVSVLLELQQQAQRYEFLALSRASIDLATEMGKYFHWSKFVIVLG